MLRRSVVRLVTWHRGSSQEMTPSLRGQAQIGWRVNAHGEQQGLKPAVNRLGTPKLEEALRLGMARKVQSFLDFSRYKPKAKPRGVLLKEGVAKVPEKHLGTINQANVTMTSTRAVRALVPAKERRQQMAETPWRKGWPTCVPSSLQEAWMLLLLNTSQPILERPQWTVQNSTVSSLNICKGRCSFPTQISGRPLLADLESPKLGDEVV